MRRRIYEIIEVAGIKDTASHIYDIFMMVTIIVSLFPLAFKDSLPIFAVIDAVTVLIFIVDYFLRFLTADYKLEGKGGWAFVLYPFTPMALIDLLSILPSFLAISSGFKILRILRLLRTLRVFRAFKFLRYSRSIDIIIAVLKKQRQELSAVAIFAVAYIIISALIVFNIEPDSFKNFFDALYWATMSLTTVGYGDIYPLTSIGRFVTMVSSILGIAIIALPSGIITAGYLNEINSGKKDNGQPVEL